jgi:endogenous inhibitor of DNA gyrase (YacG/DUF329 family)
MIFRPCPECGTPLKKATKADRFICTNKHCGWKEKR